jgi:hypothetical protein
VRRAVDLETIHPRDVVLVNQRGQVFYALVKGRRGSGYAVEPHDRGARPTIVRASEIVDHWVHAERTEPVPDGQLALEDLAG